ncbi:unnamed protein product [Calypogeia fissa]
MKTPSVPLGGRQIMMLQDEAVPRNLLRLYIAAPRNFQAPATPNNLTSSSSSNCCSSTPSPFPPLPPLPTMHVRAIKLPDLTSYELATWLSHCLPRSLSSVNSAYQPSRAQLSHQITIKAAAKTTPSSLNNHCRRAGSWIITPFSLKKLSFNLLYVFCWVELNHRDKLG